MSPHEAKISAIKIILANFNRLPTLHSTKELVEIFPPFLRVEPFSCPYPLGVHTLNPLLVNKKFILFFTDEGFEFKPL